jgi:putative hydrolase of the HAD superfamily
VAVLKRAATAAATAASAASAARGRVWLFDLDDTLHDAATASMPQLHDSMNAFIRDELGLDADAATALRRRYWQWYGATLLGLVRHHGVKPAHFLHVTHRLPGLEQRVRGHTADLALLARLPGRKFILTNAPADYARRVLGVLGIARLFDGLIAVEDMAMFGQLRPKPDARMLRHVAARLGVHPARCVLVEDTLVHQKAARRVGMATVWMQRWLPQSVSHTHSTNARRRRRPAYVDLRAHGLRALVRQPLR